MDLCQLNTRKGRVKVEYARPPKASAGGGGDCIIASWGEDAAVFPSQASGIHAQRLDAKAPLPLAITEAHFCPAYVA